MVMGSTVTNTHSGDGCGQSWPLCNGRFVPAFAEGRRTGDEPINVQPFGGGYLEFSVDSATNTAIVCFRSPTEQAESMRSRRSIQSLPERKPQRLPRLPPLQ